MSQKINESIILIDFLKRDVEFNKKQLDNHIFTIIEDIKLQEAGDDELVKAMALKTMFTSFEICSNVLLFVGSREALRGSFANEENATKSMQDDLKYFELTA